MIEILNQFILPKFVNNTTSFKKLHSIIYSGALTIIRLNGSKEIGQTNNIKTKELPKWEQRLNKRIFSRSGVEINFSDVNIVTEVEHFLPREQIFANTCSLGSFHFFDSCDKNLMGVFIFLTVVTKIQLCCQGNY
jgi:hypothetical protein